MNLISHRGNIGGAQPTFENSPSYILEAIEEGYHVEIDMWCVGDRWYLGHDDPQYLVDDIEQYIYNHNYYIHCKDIATLVEMKNLMMKQKPMDHYLKTADFFYHTEEPVIMTSSGLLWAFPGVAVPTKHACCVMPEYADWNKEDLQEIGFGAVCSDWIESFK